MVLRILLAFSLLHAAGLRADEPAGRDSRYLDQWRAVADRLIRTADPQSIVFDWGEGVQMTGLMKVHERTRDPRYAAFVERWARRFTGLDVEKLMHTGEPPDKGGRTGFCGRWSPAASILFLYEATRDPRDLAFARQAAKWVSEKAERSPEGAFGHWHGSHQLWVDTLYMACPLLAAVGRIDHNADYIEDAAQQLLLYAPHLSDPQSGLYYHMWDWQTGDRTPALWGRGNGWVLMSLAETLEVLPKSSTRHAMLRNLAETLMTGLRATQDADGMWRTVLDDAASSYPESSATSMICYGALKLVRLGVLPVSDRKVALRAWTAVNQRFVRDGLVTGTSAGTYPKETDYYRSLPLGTKTWGTGAYLMAGSEVDRLR